MVINLCRSCKVEFKFEMHTDFSITGELDIIDNVHCSHLSSRTQIFHYSQRSCKVAVVLRCALISQTLQVKTCVKILTKKIYKIKIYQIKNPNTSELIKIKHCRPTKPISFTKLSTIPYNQTPY